MKESLIMKAFNLHMTKDQNVPVETTSFDRAKLTRVPSWYEHSTSLRKQNKRSRKFEHPRSLRKQNRQGQIIQVDGKKMNSRDLCVSKTDGVIGGNFRYFDGHLAYESESNTEIEDKSFSQMLLKVKHSEHFHQFLKSGEIECFCEDVGGLLVGFYFHNSDMFLFNTFTDEVVFDLDVFGFGVLDRIFGNVGNGGVVTEDGSFMESDPVIKHLLVDPSYLGTTKGSSNVFGFGGGLGNGGLFLTLPGYKAVAKELTTSESEFLV
ncbi:hypothetical protein L1987_33197 [Smallanthus sonchifolius]|uniref:Uncharacterized protein n=1 Tax=Smallanthus sonchifolius TaxID=185202 RepID=A0ACB9HQ40_9ASTR|nr:hypothetical protein L1987_33197 [Smallanthus sonchifolius]